MRSVPRHPCAMCGRLLPAEQLTYSRFTGNRYCLDREPCDRRRARLERKREAVPA